MRDFDFDSEGNIHLVYSRFFFVYYKKWNQSSNTWGAEILIQQFPTTDHNAKIMVDSKDNIHIITGKHQYIYHRNSSDGNTWSPIIILTENGKLSETIIDDSDNIHIMYGQPYVAGGYLIYNGTDVIQDAPVPFTAESFVIDSTGNIHVTYNGAKLWYRKYDKINDQWSEAIPLVSPDPFNHASSPHMTIDSDDILHIVWLDSRDYPLVSPIYDYEVYYKSGSNETGWTSDLRLSYSNTTWWQQWYYMWPKIDYDKIYNRLGVVWTDDRDMEVEGQAELYYREYQDLTDWSPETRLTYNLSVAAPVIHYGYCKPIIKFDSLGRAHVIWSDNRDSAEGITCEIYHKYEILDPIANLMNNILQQLTELDELIETETQGCTKHILNKLSDKVLEDMNEAIDAYQNEEIHEAIINQCLVKIWLKICDKIITLADKHGRLDEDIAEDLKDRIDNIQKDLNLCIQMLLEII